MTSSSGLSLNLRWPYQATVMNRLDATSSAMGAIERMRSRLHSMVMPNWSALLQHQAHRPYPPPDRAWHMTMSWLDLLFAHWSVPAEQIRALLPAELEL